jgi:Carbohydrate family 9 binding domain-like
MIRVTSGICLGLILALASIAEAKTVSIDFTGVTPVEQGLKQVNTSAGSDGVTTIVQRRGKNVAMTGNRDTNRYLYLQIDPAFKQRLQHLWLTVVYFEEGTDSFHVEYDAQQDAHTEAANPNSRLKFNTNEFSRQTWHLTGFKLAGRQEGGADLRIDDEMDGPEFIASVTVSDEDPDFVHFPYAVNPITVDGKIDPGEWDGAYTVTLDRARYDAYAGAAWTGPNDFSGTYSYKWDENALYVLGRVVDATPRLNDNGGNGDGNEDEGDGMEQFLGLDDSNPELTDFQLTDFKVMISLGETPQWSIVALDIPDIIAELGAIKENIAIVNTDDPMGYVFELRIPWSLHNKRVTAGQRIRWHMFANNSKEIGPSNQDVAMSPSGRLKLNHDVSAWYRAILDPKP